MKKIYILVGLLIGISLIGFFQQLPDKLFMGALVGIPGLLLLQFLQTRLQVSADFRRVLDETAFEQLDRLQCRGDANGVAAERRCVCARLPVHEIRACDASADWQTRADAFRDADDVGLDVVVLAREHLAGAAHA